MNFNQHNIFGIILGWCTALWGYLAGHIESLGDWPINKWAVVVGIFGVLVNLYFAWARHRREVRVFEYDVGEREDRRTRLTREGSAP